MSWRCIREEVFVHEGPARTLDTSVCGVKGWSCAEGFLGGAVCCFFFA